MHCMIVVIPSHAHDTHTGEGQNEGFARGTHQHDERCCCRPGVSSQVCNLGTELMLLLFYLDVQSTLLTKILCEVNLCVIATLLLAI